MLNSHDLRLFLVFIFNLACLPGLYPVHVLAGTPETGVQPVDVSISFASNRMSAHLMETPLNAVLGTLAQYPQITIHATGNFEDNVSDSFSDVEIRHGMYRLLGEYDFIIEYKGLSPDGVPLEMTLWIDSGDGTHGTVSLVSSVTRSRITESEDGSEANAEPVAAIPDSLLDNLSDFDPEARVAAVQLLANHDSSLAIQYIYPLLQDQSARVREAALIALDQTGADVYLLGLLQNDEFAHIRETVMELVEDSEGEGALEFLEQSLYSQDRDIREGAVYALAEWKQPGGINALRRRWPSASAEARVMILDALIDVPEPESRQLVQLGLGDPDPEVRHQAIVVIEEIGSPLYVSALELALSDTSTTVRQAAWEVLEELSGN